MCCDFDGKTFGSQSVSLANGEELVVQFLGEKSLSCKYMYDVFCLAIEICLYATILYT